MIVVDSIFLDSFFLLISFVYKSTFPIKMHNSREDKKELDADKMKESTFLLLFEDWNKVERE